MKTKIECFIRKNTPELREKLKEIGYKLCICCEFPNWNWIHISEQGVHGISTIFDDEVDANQSELFLEEKDNSCIDCYEDENLFIAIAKFNKYE